MQHPRILMSLSLTAAAALLVGAQPAAAAPTTTATATATATAAATFKVTPSPLLDLPLVGTCPDTQPKTSIAAVQWINWMWAPLSLDSTTGEPLPQILVPKTMRLTGEGWRARHDLVPGMLYSAPGRQPSNPVTCTFEGKTAEGAIHIEISGTLVTIPKRLDALLAVLAPTKG